MRNSKIYIMILLIVTFFTFAFAEKLPRNYIKKLGKVVILDTDTGKVKDEFKKESTHLWHPQIINNYLIVNEHTAKSKTVKAYNLNTRKIVWEAESDSFGHFKRGSRDRVYENKKIFFRNGNEVIALDVIKGKKLWKYKNNSERLFHGISLLGEIVLAEAKLSEKIYAIDKNTGQLRWTYSGAKFISFILDIVSDPILLMSDGNLIALNPINGEKLWEISNVAFGSNRVFENTRKV